tara:strand:+ start:68 stop:787 length:720 start_codon:yes stop_codon:yes gene_type:complete
MRTLISQGKFGNKISIIYIEEHGIIRKFTSDKSKYKYIENEFRGLNWYKKHSKDKFELFEINKFNDFICLDIKMHLGKSIFYRAPLRITKNHILKVIRHYIDIMCHTSNTIMHGDLTLSNVIFTESGPKFIDWEHFSEGDIYWGIDLIYLVLSSIILPLKKNQSPNKKDILIFQKIWEQLIDLGIDRELTKKPLTYFRNYFKKHSFWREIAEESPLKLFPLNLTEEKTDYFENKILKKY